MISGAENMIIFWRKYSNRNIMNLYYPKNPDYKMNEKIDIYGARANNLTNLIMEELSAF